MSTKLLFSLAVGAAALVTPACAQYDAADLGASPRTQPTIEVASTPSLKNRVQSTCKALQLELHSCITAMMENRPLDPYRSTAQLRAEPKQAAIAPKPVQQASRKADPIQSMADAEAATIADPIARFAELSETRQARFKEAERSCRMRAPHRRFTATACG